MDPDHSYSINPEIIRMTSHLESEFEAAMEENEAEDVFEETFEANDDDDMVEWDKFNADHPSETAPDCGGLFLTEDDKVIAFVGTDPDAKVNVWSYDLTKKKYVINKSNQNKKLPHQQGTTWNGQYRPSGLKDIKKVEDTCKEYKGTKFDGLVGKDGGAPPLALITYKEIICRHLIKNGMWDVFKHIHPKIK